MSPSQYDLIHDDTAPESASKAVTETPEATNTPTQNTVDTDKDVAPTLTLDSGEREGDEPPHRNYHPKKSNKWQNNTTNENIIIGMINKQCKVTHTQAP